MRGFASACAVLLCVVLSSVAAAQNLPQSRWPSQSLQQGYDAPPPPRPGHGATVTEVTFFVADAPERTPESIHEAPAATGRTVQSRRVEAAEGGQLRMAPVPPPEPVQAGVPLVAKGEAPANLRSPSHESVVASVVPNLTPYRPSSWTDKMVISPVYGSTTDAAPLYTSDYLYLDWAILNDSSVATSSSYTIQLWVDGIYWTYWVADPGLGAYYYNYILDYGLGNLSSGWHNVQIVADAYNDIGESNESDNTYTKPFYVTGGTPDLTPYQPAGWSNKIVLSNVAGTNTDTTLYANNPTYIDWAVLNDGSAPAGLFFVEIWIDGSHWNTWTTYDALPAAWYFYVEDEAVTLSAGWHTIQVRADTAFEVAESDENDNWYARSLPVTGGLPNLTPYKPATWSDKIVISNTTGTNTNSTLLPGQTLYLDWAVINNGAIPNNAYFDVQIWIDGSLRDTWTVVFSLFPNGYAYVEDYSLGTFAAGTHTALIVVDPGNAVSETNETDNQYLRQFTVNAQVNLTPYQPGTWSAKLPLSNQTGTNADGASIYANQTVYLDWAVLNNGTTNAPSAYSVRIKVDGIVKGTFTVPAGHQAGQYAQVVDFPIGSYPVGTHTAEIMADSGLVIGESNESDNVYSRTFNVIGGNPNIAPYKPSTWSDKIVVSHSTGTTTDGTLATGQAIYLDWAVVNNGAATAPGPWTMQLWVDGVYRTSWTVNASLGPGVHTYYLDYALGTLTAGTHTLRVVADAGNAVGESNESDNEYTKTVYLPPPGGGVPDIRVSPLSLSFSSPATTSIDEQSLEERPDYLLHLQSGIVDPLQTGTRREDLSYVRADGNGHHLLAQFQRELSADDVAGFEKEGIRVLGYVPNYAYWVSTPAAAKLAGTNAGGGLRAVVRPDVAVKATLALDPRNFPPNARAMTGTVAVRVRRFEDVDAEAFEAALRSAGFPESLPLYGNVRELMILPMEIPRLAELDEVEWIEPGLPPRIEHNAVAAERIRAGALTSAPYSLSGSGVTVGVWDGGRVDPHSDFGSRLNIADTGASVSPHATHVAGTIAGSGAGDWTARGHARSATVWSYDWNSDTTEMRSAPSLRNITISNHSYGYVAGWHWNGSAWVDYGTTLFGLYDSQVAEWDDVVRDVSLTVFKSAGNDRSDGPDWPTGPFMDGPFDTISSTGNAKNIITVAASTDTDGMSTFSSFGPTNDGRVKPDVTANGTGLWSTVPGNSYASYTGTSMASPSAAGSGALLLQQLNALSIPSSPDLIKALMIHGARDYGRTGPDYEYGWGLLDMTKSVTLAKNRSFRKNSIASSTDKKIYGINVAGGSTSLRVTLVWTDPPGSPAAAKMLVNDLNMVLISPTGVVHRTWVLNPASPAAAATRGVNSRDNVEQIVVSSPEVGQWKVKIYGSVVPSGPQPFVVVAEGIADNIWAHVTIYNDGSGPLNVTGIAPGTPASWISWTPAAPFTVAAGASKTISVMVNFNTAPLGTSGTRRLLVSSNDPDENPVPNAVYVNIQN